MGNNCKLHFITSCTQSKSSKLGRPVSLSSIESNGDLNVDEWLQKLFKNPPKAKAIDVYNGDHWSVAKDILDKYADELWVLSAGYGLINANTEITAYDATFSAGSESSISNHFAQALSLKDRNKYWWNKLTETNDFTISLNYLFDQYKGDIFVIAAAPAYLKVIQEDIIDCISSGIIDEKHLLIVSSETVNTLDNYSVKTKEKLRTHREIKGSLISLNNRVARYLLSVGYQNQFDITEMKKSYLAIDNEVKDVKRASVRKVTDEELTNMIRVELASTQGIRISASILLRQFRNAGLSCEQKRFFRLFKSAQTAVVE